jgi:exosortase A
MSAVLPAARSDMGYARLLPGLLVWLGLLFLFRGTVREMMAAYDRSDTFAHAYLVPPLSLWMIWRLRHRLARLPTKPQPWVLALMGAACSLWLLGELAVVNAASQLALVSLIVLTVPMMYGMAVTRAMLFPLLFLFFAVPMGLFLVPLMMEHTANFTIAALRLSGIPVYREGLQFVIPSGSWSVVEACSGVRYLIASFMVGCLFAYLNYTSWKRRLLFMAFSVAVAVVANWLRAYLIVMLGHYSGNTLAVGVDHLIYGWVFFGLVICVMFLIGSRWAQPNEPLGPTSAAIEAATGATPGATPGLAQLGARAKRSWAVALVALALLGATQALFSALERPSGLAQQPLKLPERLGSDWVASDQDFTVWEPAFSGARSTDRRAYVSSASADPSAARRVGVWAGFYRDQGRSNKMVTSANSLSRVEESNWAQVSTTSQTVTTPDGQNLVFRSTLLRGPGEPGSAAAQRLLVLQMYWLGGQSYTASDARAKLMMVANRLRGKGDDSAALILYTPAGANEQSLGQAQEALTRLVSQRWPELTAPLRGLERRTASP